MNHKNILVIQTAFLGDVILITPLLSALTEIFPDSKIDVLTIPETSQVFKYDPRIRETLEFDKKKSDKKIGSFIKVINIIRERQYALAISIQSSLTSSLLMLFGNIKVRVGFKRQYFLTHPVTHKRGMHMRHRYLALITPFSDQKFDDQTKISWSGKEETLAHEIIEQSVKKNQQKIGIAPGSVWNTKKWLFEYFVSLIDKLAERKYFVFLIGGPADKQLCDSLLFNCKNKHVKNLAGQLSILESAAIIDKLDLMISNDSAPLHIANAVKTDVFAFFGPTVKRFGCYPFRKNDKMLEVDLNCRPCGKHGGNRCPKKHFNCMKNITPDFVFQEIESYFGRKSA